MKNSVFWDVAPCTSCVNRRFGGMSVHTRSIRRHVPENGILQFVYCFPVNGRLLFFHTNPELVQG
jgi:hypothetical protein